MSDRQKDEQKDEQKAEQPEVEDLAVPAEESDDVKGGKVQFQDFHFTQKVDTSSP